MKDAVQFLMRVFGGDIKNISHLANVLNAQAENDKDTILKYLMSVKEYTEELIEKVKNNE